MKDSDVKKDLEEGEEKKGSKSKYIINARGVFSVYFARYFFVILIGEDRRQSTVDVVDERRGRAAFWGNLTFFLFVIFPYIALFVLVLYFLKAALGIDVFPDIHWPHVFNGWLK